MIKSIARMSFDICEASFTSCYLIRNAHFPGSKKSGIPSITFVELRRDGFFEIVLASESRIFSDHYIATCESQQHERSSDHNAFDAAETENDTKAADAKSDDGKDAIESFCQDHVHALTSGMILATATRIATGHDIRRGGVWRRIRDRWTHDWRFNSHGENIPETSAK